MLRKLLKYELRANLKIYLFIWPSILGFSLLETIFTSNLFLIMVMQTLFQILTMLFVLAMLGACICSLIVAIRRFYIGLLRDEGYLMFTLPVKPWQLVLSKLLVAVLMIAITVFVCAAAIAIMTSGVVGVWRELIYMFQQITPLSTWSAILTGLLYLVTICSNILQIYLACAIGHLAHSKRILWAVLAYFGIDLLIGFLPFYNMTDILLQGSGYNGLLGVTLAIQGAFCLVCFFLTELILRKRLNLE